MDLWISENYYIENCLCDFYVNWTRVHVCFFILFGIIVIDYDPWGPLFICACICLFVMLCCFVSLFRIIMIIIE